MPKIIQPAEDEWFGVQDAKKRKQIQDRLAQRARRMRLAKSPETVTTPSTTPSESQSPPSFLDLVRLRSERSKLPKKKGYWLSLHSLTTPSPEPTLSQDHAHINIPMFTVYSALFRNGVILGIPCATSAVHKSRPCAPHVPESLRPLKIQLDQMHYSCIDRLPQKALRQKLIDLGDRFNMEEWVADLFTMPTFLIEPGCQSWDPSGWSIAPEFRSKWSIIFDEVEPLTPGSIESPES